MGEINFLQSSSLMLQIKIWFSYLHGLEVEVAVEMEMDGEMAVPTDVAGEHLGEIEEGAVPRDGQIASFAVVLKVSEGEPVPPVPHLIVGHGRHQAAVDVLEAVAVGELREDLEESLLHRVSPHDDELSANNSEPSLRNRRMRLKEFVKSLVLLLLRVKQFVLQNYAFEIPALSRFFIT